MISNLFKVFDPDNSGSVVPTELLVAFSMSMKGSVTDKLRYCIERMVQLQVEVKIKNLYQFPVKWTKT